MVNFIRKATKKSLLALLKRGDKMTRSDWERLFEGVLFKDEYETFSGAGGLDHGDMSGLADDDHPRYVDIDGSHPLTANWDVGAFDIRAADLTADSGGVCTDTVTELTGAAGVTIDGVLFKDDDIETVVNVDASGTVKADTINEYTGATGVTVEGIEIKDSNIAAVDYAFVTNNDSDTDVTAAEIEELTDGSDTVLHTHSLAGDTVCLSTYTDVKARNTAYHLHGHLHSIDTAHDLSGGDLVVTVGTSKVMIVVNAGGDLVGTITVSGTQYDRNTGEVTANFGETISVNGAGVETFATDTNGVGRHFISGAYLTSNWYLDTVTISTTDVAYTDVNVWHISFEQFNDTPSITVNTFDINAFSTNENAWMSANLYAVERGAGNLASVSGLAHLEVLTADYANDTYHRRRRGNLNHDLDGTKEGVFVDLELGPINQAYWQNVTLKVWAHEHITIG